mmetsp:Transcript_47370/g.153776  ORF Transcript_47370/g.153776 Transcript_47370/m.153776 type:complete len:172 (-) Transcript_47370:170-685(-)
MGGHAAAAAKRRREQESAYEATDDVDSCIPHVTAASLTKHGCAFQRVVKAYTQRNELPNAARVQLQALRAVIASDDANAADVVDFLISRVVCEVDNTNAAPELGRPPLHLALERRGFSGQLRIVHALIAAGASTTSRFPNGRHGHMSATDIADGKFEGLLDIITGLPRAPF